VARGSRRASRSADRAAPRRAARRGGGDVGRDEGSHVRDRRCADRGAREAVPGEVRVAWMPRGVVDAAANACYVLAAVAASGGSCADAVTCPRALIDRYPHVLDNCVGNGYRYADLFTEDGTFGASSEWGEAKIWFRGREQPRGHAAAQSRERVARLRLGRRLASPPRARSENKPGDQQRQRWRLGNGHRRRFARGERNDFPVVPELLPGQ